MTLENTKKKLKAEKLPVWNLSVINSRGVPSLISKFTEDDIARSIKYLDEQVKFFSNENEETCFEIVAKANKNSNGPNAELRWEFCVPATKVKEDPGARFNGTSGYAGLGMLEHPYVQRELTELQRLKSKYEEKYESLAEKRTEILLAQNNLDRDKEYWNREHAKRETDWNEVKKKAEAELSGLKEKYSKRTEAGREALNNFVDERLLPLFGEFFAAGAAENNDLSGAPETAEEKAIKSIAFTIHKHREHLDMDDIKRIGLTVGKLIQKIKQEKEETAPA